MDLFKIHARLAHFFYIFINQLVKFVKYLSIVITNWFYYTYFIRSQLLQNVYPMIALS